MDTELVRAILFEFRNDFSPKSAVDIFRAIDNDNSGSIDHLELYHTIHHLTGFPVSKEHIVNIMEKVDFDGDGGIDFLEFLMLLKGIVDFHRRNAEALRAEQENDEAQADEEEQEQEEEEETD